MNRSTLIALARHRKNKDLPLTSEAVDAEAGEESEAGFTLIELLVVLLIMAILMAIAIPTFLGVRSSAQNRSAQTSLRNALTTVQGYYSHGDTYTGMTPTVLSSSEPALKWTTSTVPTTGTATTISVYTGSGGQSMEIANLSASGKCYFIADVESTSSANAGFDSSGPSVGTFYGVGNPASGTTPATACAAAAPTTTGITWTTNGWT